MSKVSPIRLFICYSHKDERQRIALGDHLAQMQREGVIATWDDRKITAGQEWAGEISSKLEAADIILCLVSAGFLASPYCNDKELQRAMERHEAGEALVIPVILKPADWATSSLGRLQALPANAKPVTTWSNRDQAFALVAQGIRDAAQKLSEERPSQALSPQSQAPTTPPALTQSPPPGSIQSLNSTISYLSPIDSAVLKLACEEALIIGHENIDSCKVFLSNGQPRFPIAELKDSLKILDQQKLIKCRGLIGGPEVPRVLITSIGFEIFAKDCIEDYSTVVSAVIAAIVNSETLTNQALAKELTREPFLIDHILDLLKNNGDIALTEYAGGLKRVYNVSPNLKRSLGS
jgi:hypothetical protein